MNDPNSCVQIILMDKYSEYSRILVINVTNDLRRI